MKQRQPLRRRIAEEAPHGHAGQDRGRVADRIAIAQQAAEHHREHDGHRDRVEQRPADAQDGPAVALSQVQLDQRHQEMAELPNCRQRAGSSVTPGAGRFAAKLPDALHSFPDQFLGPFHPNPVHQNPELFPIEPLRYIGIRGEYAPAQL